MNENLINEIRHRYTEGFSIHDIMLHYGIMEAEVVAIIRGVSPLSNVRIPVRMRRKNVIKRNENKKQIDVLGMGYEI